MNRRLYGAVVLAAVVAIGFAASGASASIPKPVTFGHAAGASPTPATVSSSTLTTTYTFSTTSGVLYCSANQGWWNTAQTNGNCNTNYILIHNYPGFGNYDNYFTFDISGWTNPCPVQSAYLTVNSAGGGYANGAPTLHYGLFDVSTDPFTLNDKVNNPNTTIYNDLGSGAMYGGPYTLSVSDFGHWYNLGLDSAAFNALNAAHANHQAYFSIGGALINAPVNSYLFNASGSNAVSLTITVGKLCKVT